MTIRVEQKNRTVKIAMIVVCIFIVYIASAQKKIGLTHVYYLKEMKVYRMDGAEVYMIVGRDTIFVPKVAEYSFVTNPEVDSATLSKDKYVTFMVKTPNKIFFLTVESEAYRLNDEFRFTFYVTPQSRKKSVGAVTLPNGASRANVIETIPNKVWFRKFYPYCGNSF